MTSGPTSEKNLRVGILLDGTSVSKHVYEFIKWTLSNENLTLKAIFVRSLAHVPSSCELGRWDQGYERPARSFAALCFEFVLLIERLLLFKNRDHRHHLQRFKLTSFLPTGIIRDEPTDEYAIRAPDVDLLVTFAPRPFGEGVWSIATLGVIALSTSDDRMYRGGPPGFWEVYFREDVTGFAIERLQPSADQNETLFRGRIATQFYFLLNQAWLFQRSGHYLEKFVERIAATRRLPVGIEKLPFSRIPQHAPAVHQILRYALRLGGRLAVKLMQKLGVDTRWRVAFLPGGWRGAAFWRASVIENDPGHYLADPFVIARDGRHFCFVEDYDLARKRGHIAVYELGGGRATSVGVALREDFHLSYPYLFEYQGGLYMCPETSAAREIRVYKCIEFPLRWKLESTLMKGVSAADTMLFERGGRWWMLTNIDPAGWGDHSLELHVFSADTPLERQWKSHPGNPFFIDAACARNGGMVKEGDRLFRVAQGHGFAMYGKRTIINEIVELTDERYHEKPICVISPNFRPKISGTHHLHSDGSVTVLDFA